MCSVHQATEEALFCAGRVAHFKCLAEASESPLEFLIREVSSVANGQIVACWFLSDFCLLNALLHSDLCQCL